MGWTTPSPLWRGHDDPCLQLGQLPHPIARPPLRSRREVTSEQIAKGQELAAEYWLYDTDVTHVILQCEWQQVDRDDPTGALLTYDRHYIIKKERFSDRITALYRPKLELSVVDNEIEGITKQYNVRFQNQNRFDFSKYDESVKHVFRRKSGDLFFYEKNYVESFEELAKRGSLWAKRTLEVLYDNHSPIGPVHVGHWTKALGCKPITQANLDKAIETRIHEIRAGQKF